MDRRQAVFEIGTLRSQGMTNKQIAAHLGMSHSTISNIINDPDGSKQRARRERYAGTCQGCGGKTDGSNGASKAPQWCHLCAHDHYRRWTRGTVIAAIWIWAAEHDGKPPSATQWGHASEDGRFPSATAVYGGGAYNGTAPFRYWGDAVEAAGFPRPRIGCYDRQLWDPESIIEAIQRWNEERGEPPVMEDWRPTPEGYPSSKTVQAHLGSWANGIEQAGFPRPRVGKNRRVAA